jgi:hypothetical protein
MVAPQIIIEKTPVESLDTLNGWPHISDSDGRHQIGGDPGISRAIPRNCVTCTHQDTSVRGDYNGDCTYTPETGQTPREMFGVNGDGHLGFRVRKKVNGNTVTKIVAEYCPHYELKH